MRFVMFALRYGLKSMWRNPRRSLLTLATILLAASVTIVAKRYSAAVMGLWQKSSSDTGTAHLQVHTAAYAKQTDGLSPDLLFKASDSVMEKTVAGLPEVSATARRLRFEGMIAVGDRNLYFVAQGIEPSREALVSPLLWTPKPKDHPRGRFVQDDDITGITVGEGLANALGLKVGDEATLLSQTLQGSANAIDVKIIGIIQIPLPSFSKRAVFLHIDLARKLLRAPDAYTEYAVRLTDAIFAEAVVHRLKQHAQASDWDVRGWWDIDPIIRKVERIINAVVGVLLGLLALSAGLSVLNIVFMLVLERTVEIGTLAALGMPPRRILLLFCFESMIYGVVGGLFGVCMGMATVYGMGQLGMPFDIPFGTGKVLLYPTNDWRTSSQAFLVALTIAALAAILPAKRAAGVEPVKAFRGQMN